MNNRFTLILLIFFLTITVKSQDTLYTYFDSNWNKTSKKDYQYYRKAYKAGKKKWIVNDFYKSGNLQMVGQYKSKRFKKKDGLFVYYYEDGSMDHSGPYLQNERNGEWQWFFNNGQKSARETYDNDSLIAYSFWNEDGTEATFKQAMCKPKYVGGEDALLKYLDENIEYPVNARIIGHRGKVIISFIVNKKGQVENAKVVKPVHPTLDHEALRVVKSLPDWIPGKQHNRVVRVRFKIPITFKLN